VIIATQGPLRMYLSRLLAPFALKEQYLGWERVSVAPHVRLGSTQIKIPRMYVSLVRRESCLILDQVVATDAAPKEPTEKSGGRIVSLVPQDILL